MSRITSAEVQDLATTALQLYHGDENHPRQHAMSLHDVANVAWNPTKEDPRTDGNRLPEVATAPALDANLRIRKELESTGMVVVPITLSYFRKIRSRAWSEETISACLPRRGHQQYGLLFIDEDSTERDIAVWQTWVNREVSSSSTRSRNARTSVHNAVRAALITELESHKLLAIESGNVAGEAEAS